MEQKPALGLMGVSPLTTVLAINSLSLQQVQHGMHWILHRQSQILTVSSVCFPITEKSFSLVRIRSSSGETWERRISHFKLSRAQRRNSVWLPDGRFVSSIQGWRL